MTNPIQVRRVVTGHDGSGASVVTIDEPAAASARLAQVWTTASAPADNRDPTDGALLPIALDAPPGGSRFWIVAMPVGYGLDPAARAETAHRLAQQGAAVSSQTEQTHATRTTDYVIVLEGEITLILDQDEVVLRRHDCVVQRGTSHHWENRGDTDALVAFVLLDAHPLGSPT